MEIGQNFSKNIIQKLVINNPKRYL